VPQQAIIELVTVLRRSLGRQTPYLSAYETGSMAIAAKIVSLTAPKGDNREANMPYQSSGVAGKLVRNIQ
jgi:hypothetical protein